MNSKLTIEPECFEYFCQLLVDTNMPLLILKMLNLWFPPVKEGQKVGNLWLSQQDPERLWFEFLN